MRIITLPMIMMLCMSCATDKPVVDTGTVKPVNKPIVAATTGWADEDTYTVKVTGADLERATDMARHKILKDIVNVRVRNGSRYTDITKISGEFEQPLKEGKVIKQDSVEGGVEIYYQISDKGLKKKFERQ